MSNLTLFFDTISHLHTHTETFIRILSFYHYKTYAVYCLICHCRCRQYSNRQRSYQAHKHNKHNITVIRIQGIFNNTHLKLSTNRALLLKE